MLRLLSIVLTLTASVTSHAEGRACAPNDSSVYGVNGAPRGCLPNDFVKLIGGTVSVHPADVSSCQGLATLHGLGNPAATAMAKRLECIQNLTNLGAAASPDCNLYALNEPMFGQETYLPYAGPGQAVACVNTSILEGIVQLAFSR